MHMTNGASFNLTNKKLNSNFDNQSTGGGEVNSYQNSYNQNFMPGSGQESVAGASFQSQGGGGSGLNIKNQKNVLSGPLHNKIKPIGSSHMEQREKKMKDAYKNAKPKGKGMNQFGEINNQVVMQYS